MASAPGDPAGSKNGLNQYDDGEPCLYYFLVTHAIMGRDFDSFDYAVRSLVHFNKAILST